VHRCACGCRCTRCIDVNYEQNGFSAHSPALPNHGRILHSPSLPYPCPTIPFPAIYPSIPHPSLPHPFPITSFPYSIPSLLYPSLMHPFPSASLPHRIPSLPHPFPTFFSTASFRNYIPSLTAVPFIHIVSLPTSFSLSISLADKNISYGFFIPLEYQPNRTLRLLKLFRVDTVQ
jgi:hypothetical protein